ncbi:MAG: hypothetical protein WAK96_02855 [Desulfobaccales bacterium]
MNDIKKENVIPISDAAHILGISELDIEKWINEDKPIMSEDYMGSLCIPVDFLDKFASKPDFKEAVLRAEIAEIKRRAKDETTRQNELFRVQRLSLLDDYNKYILDLEILHKKYLNIVDIMYNENGLTAAYILFYKVISLLYLTCECLRLGYWYSGSFLREIDETLDVAHYFTIAENTGHGQKYLKNWFRLNKAPKHKVCRDAISKWESSINPNLSETNWRSLKNELYAKKSKWIHPTLNSIRELMIVEEHNGRLTVKGYDYKSCGYERKLIELTHFFRSSIWTAYQVFIRCFHDKIPLDEADKNIIKNYNKLFKILDIKFHDW